MDYPIIFDGKSFAKERERELGDYLFDLKKKKVFVTPKLNVLLIGNNPASELYVKKKIEACERVGIEVELFRVNTIQREAKYVVNLIKLMNQDEAVHGIMVQLPLPEKYRKETTMILEAIDPAKDVDGLTKDSPFDAATGRAVLTIAKEAQKLVKDIPEKPKVLVVGSKGMAGRGIVRSFERAGYDVRGVDKRGEIYRSKISTSLTLSAHILVSATGVPYVIRNRNVAPHAIVIDVGSPKPDVEMEGVSKRADFVTPVPGGVGPLTVISLLQNVVEAAVAKIKSN